MKEFMDYKTMFAQSIGLKGPLKIERTVLKKITAAMPSLTFQAIGVSLKQGGNRQCCCRRNQLSKYTVNLEITRKYKG